MRKMRDLLGLTNNVKHTNNKSLVGKKNAILVFIELLRKFSLHCIHSYRWEPQITIYRIHIVKPNKRSKHNNIV
jgi:hypothetical protein